MINNYPPTYLFTWNADPKHGEWGNNLEQYIDQLRNTGKFVDIWRCSNKSAKVGDRAFLIKLGDGEKGIFGSGYISSEPFTEKHWSDKSKSDVVYVSIDFDILINPWAGEILPIESLKSPQSVLANQHWSSQSSGIEIRKEVVPALEEVWLTYLILNNSDAAHRLVDSTENKFVEGKSHEFLSVRFERNPYARNACLEFYGYKCSVCDFDFQEFYGEIGRYFIHVHHLTQVSSIGKQYEVDPVKDMRPVCPNCHAILHKRNIPFTIDELKSKIKKTAIES
jgi:5-methylcytosine-specific restriction protein A